MSKKFRLHAHIAVAVSLAIALSACGGGGGGTSSSSSNQGGSDIVTPPAPSQTPQVQGNFDVSGSPAFTDGSGKATTYKAFVANSSAFVMVDANCNLYSGNLGQVSGTPNTSLIGTQFLPQYCNGVQRTAPSGAVLSTGFTGTGSMPTGPNSAYSLTYQGPPANATWTFTPTADNARTASVAQLVNSTFKSADGVLTLSFPASGGVAGSMVIDGVVQQVSGGSVALETLSGSAVIMNQFTLSFVLAGVQYTAYASLDDSGSGSENALTLIGFAGRNVIQETLVKQ
jgi:hypothetical protein